MAGSLPLLYFENRSLSGNSKNRMLPPLLQHHRPQKELNCTADRPSPPENRSSPFGDWMTGHFAAKVTQTSESAVSQVSKPADLEYSERLPIWKLAIQQAWKPALHGA